MISGNSNGEIKKPELFKGWMKKVPRNVSSPAGNALKRMIGIDWESRYFVLDDGKLSYYGEEQYKFPYGKDIRGTVCLRDAFIASKNHRQTNDQQLLLLSKETSENILYLTCQSIESTNQWRKAFEEHILYVSNDSSQNNLKSTTVDNQNNLNINTKTNPLYKPSKSPTSSNYNFTFPNNEELQDKKEFDIKSSIEGVAKILGEKITDQNFEKLSASDVGQAALKILTSIGSKIPIFGEFLYIVDDLLIVFENFQANKKAAMRLGERLLEIIGKLLPELEKVRSVNELLREKFKVLNEKLIEANLMFRNFIPEGKKIWSTISRIIKAQSRKPEEMFNSVDDEITSIINEVFQLLGLQALQISYQTYDKLVDMADNIDKILREQELGYAQDLPVRCLRDFWSHYFKRDRKVIIVEIIEHLKDYFNEMKNDISFADNVLIELFSTFDKDNDGYLSVLEIKQATRSIPPETTLSKTIHYLVIGKDRKLIIPSIDPKLKVIWGKEVFENIKSFVMNSNNSKINLIGLYGQTNSGKTCRLLAAVNHFGEMDPTVSILWVDLKGLHSIDDVWRSISNELTIEGNGTAEYQKNFKTLLQSFYIINNQKLKSRCIIVFDHVNNQSMKSCEELIEIIIKEESNFNLLSAIFISNKESCLTFPSFISSHVKNITIEALNIDEATDLCASLGITEIDKIDFLVKASKGLPGEIKKLSIIKDSNNINADTNANVLLKLLSHEDLIVAACLYPVFKIGFVFDEELAWLLCIGNITNKDSMLKSIDNLLNIQWLNQKSDQGYFIPSIILNPRCDKDKILDNITDQSQCDRYFQYMIEKINTIDDLLDGKNQVIGLMTCESCLNSVAICLRGLVKPEEAIELYKESLLIDKNIFDNDHVNVAISLCNIANFLRDLNKYEEALELYRDALIIEREKCKDGDGLHVALILNNMAFTLQDSNRKDEALSMFQEALAIRKSILGDDHSVVADSTCRIADIFFDTSNYDEALEMHKTSLEIRKKLFGSKPHTDVAISLNDVGRCYRMLKKDSEALTFYLESLSIRKVIYGNESSQIAIILRNIGNTLKDLNRKDEALDMYQQALAIQKKNNKPADVADTLYKLAVLLKDLGRIDELGGELEMFREKLAIQRKLNGDEHTEVATTMNILGDLLFDLDKNEEALEMHKTSLEIRKKLFGSKPHTDVAISLNDVGRCYRRLKNNSEALKLYLESLSIRKVIYGNESSQIAIILRNIGNTLKDLNRKDEALDMYQQALTIQKKNNKPADVADTIDRLALLFKELGRKDETMEMLREKLEIQRKLNGDEHTEVATTMNTLGDLLFDLDKNEEALEMHKTSLEIRKKLFGSKPHTDVAISLNDVGRCYRRLKNNSEALKLYLESLSIRKNISGNESSEVAIILRNIGNTLKDLNRKDEALDMYQQALAIQKKNNKPADVADTLDRLALLLTSLGRKEEAVVARAEAAEARQKKK